MAGFLGGTAFIQAEVLFSLYRGGAPTHFPQPAQLGGGPLPASDAGPQARIQKKRDTLKDIPNQSGESRGEKLSPLVFFPPFLTGEMEAAGRHPPGRCAPRPLWRHGPKGPYPRGPGPRPHGAGLNLRPSQRQGVPPPTGGLTPPARRSGGPCWPASARRRRSTPRRRGSPG